ncbi:MAG: 50S ribosomal protein L35ae [Nanoarchaeota archaeon]|nr:50S ribosomal protein L35ae [Nanoarchaeota archaeon]
MEGTILNYKKGMHTQKNDEMIVKVLGVDSKAEAEKLVSKSVEWVSPSGKTIKGKIVKAHGNKGALKVKFEKGMPGQSITTKLKVL